jgi:hypothetical protein
MVSFYLERMPCRSRVLLGACSVVVTCEKLGHTVVDLQLLDGLGFSIRLVGQGVV